MDVDRLLMDALPEFSSTVREHRSDYPDDPMLYLLLAPLFDFVVERFAGDPDVAVRAYAVVEKIMEDGSPYVRDAFAIEMLEPLAQDNNHEFSPDLEPFMGPVTKKEFVAMRKWFDEYEG